VRAFASREATLERRQSYAALVRGRLGEARLVGDVRVLAVVDELETLVSELEDDDLSLEPASAVACMRLLSDIGQSPLLNRSLPAEDLRSRVRQIRSGFGPRGSFDPSERAAAGVVTARDVPDRVSTAGGG